MGAPSTGMNDTGNDSKPTSARGGQPPLPTHGATSDLPEEGRPVQGPADPPSPVAELPHRAGGSDRVEELEAEVEALRRQLEDVRRGGGAHRPANDELIELDDALLLQQVGIYEYHHPLENAEMYRERLAALREDIKDAVRSGNAIEASDRFAYNNSLAAGRKMTADFSKLMLRAYNAEADNCVRSLRAGALVTATKRLETAAATIAKLGKMMEMHVADGYHALRITELELTADYLFKQQEEREAAREERERLREERKAEAELAAQREKLNKERAHYTNTLAAVRASGTPEEVAALVSRLSDLDAAIELNDFRAANIRAGYVYVISNIGAFGKSVVKIGMTRRLEPMDRVRELGDASVPFPFDVHAIYFSDDAITLENELHHAFADRRLNQANLRREFFFATPEEVRDVLAEKVGNLLEYAAAPEAEQYYQSLPAWPVPS
ncbi:DUF4041 domain-containing protein [Geodermatophilus sp. Leaf369]|uniref:DUF4041 domain-containing protein n=1 Tax=Geodermatophilus sp. Leaf369 TaxID=1736354 RepID=UPI0019106668|nr:DUF4041 domain-containing protein [Geodermatophilus sp. Leaf369]